MLQALKEFVEDRPAYVPKGYKRIKVVHNLSRLFNADYGSAANCILYPRRLTGDFNALAGRLMHAFKCTNSKVVYISSSDLSGYAKQREETERDGALQAVLDDVEMLDRTVFSPQLRLVSQNMYGPDVYRFHADGESNSASRVLCCYNDPGTEWLKNEDAIPDPDEEGFYSSRSDARPCRFGAGDIWRFATRGHRNPPFIHRASEIAEPDAPPRMVLVASARRFT